jgi:hypothetical protein
MVGRQTWLGLAWYTVHKGPGRIDEAHSPSNVSIHDHSFSRTVCSLLGYGLKHSLHQQLRDFSQVWRYASIVPRYGWLGTG